MIVYRFYKPLNGPAVLQSVDSASSGDQWRYLCDASDITKEFEQDPFEPFFQTAAAKAGLTPSTVAVVMKALRAAMEEATPNAVDPTQP